MDDVLSKTGIHTKVNSKYRMSSVYRRYEIHDSLFYGWETILWRKCENGREEIADKIASSGDAQCIVDIHTGYYDSINNNDGEWNDELQGQKDSKSE